jgi:2-oxoglutarate ferredoxin oxidoreductase subunit beta
MTDTGARYQRSDFQTDQEVRWCPGCGDYTILATVQNFLAGLDVDREKHVFVSGIGCAARFPYYMETYGMHSIHGRAPAIASGIVAANPDLTVWVVTGDGDSLSIGGNHLIHTLRRNVNLKILMFNNQIYGLTKGQYSPTSEVGKLTKTSPMGSIDHPFNPVSLALGAEATFVARTIDMDREHSTKVLAEAYAHRGSAFVEIYQNCNVFNDKAIIQLMAGLRASRSANAGASSALRAPCSRPSPCSPAFPPASMSSKSRVRQMLWPAT